MPMSKKEMQRRWAEKEAQRQDIIKNRDWSSIYSIYVGLILLAGLVVGAAVVLYEEIEKLRKEDKSIRGEAEKSKQE